MLAQSCDTDEFTAATTGIEQKIARYGAFLREAAFAEPGANVQAVRIAESAVWILPKPSGHNLAFGMEEPMTAYRAF
ncbi:hypothetical protein ACIP86_03925 [Pseudomonas neuropathica]